MKLVGFSVEDGTGTGVSGEVPLRGLTVLFGKNGAGKSLLLESLASLLHSSTEWVGRRSRINDESYAVGYLYLSGDWEGADWPWLSDVLAADVDADNRSSFEVTTAAGRTYAVFNDFVDALVKALTSDHREAVDLSDLIGPLLREMCLGYQPHELAQITAAVDTALLDDSTRRTRGLGWLGATQREPSLVRCDR